MSAQGQPSGAKTTTTGSVEQEVMGLERRLIDAALQSDTATVERLYADDFIFTGSFGEVFDKAQAIALLRSGDLRYEAINTEDVRVRVYGDTAVTIGRATIRAHYHGQDASGPYRYTVVYVKRGGQWQEVAFHTSRIAQG